MPLETLNPGTQSFGNYDVVGKIADGGMGSVYRARHRVTQDTVAIKVIPPLLAKNEVMCKRLEQEYNAARHLNHPNIVRALEFGFQGPSPYLVMEFVDGESLGQRIERDGRIPEPECIHLITQVAQGLHEAHKKGMIHRDVKPDNILVTKTGEAKLTDLGLVKELETDLNLTRTGRGLGTPHFMAPEQFRNAKKADIRCDIYSLAASLYQMVTGELPFKLCGPLDAWMKKINNELPAPRTACPLVSERVDWAIRRAMSADPLQRPATCREFLEDLTGQPTQKMEDVDAGDLWYLYYRDQDGVVYTLKGKLSSIRRSLKEGKWKQLEQIRVARTKMGPFEPLRKVAEFQDFAAQMESLANTAMAELPTVPIKNKNPDETSDSISSPTPPPATRARPTNLPGINLDDQLADSGEGGKWIALIFLAFAAGMGGFFLVPMLRHWGIL